MEALEVYKDFIATTASFSTVLLFMTGMFTARKIIGRKSVGEDSSVPFVTGFLSCSLWLRYGVLIADGTVILVNMIGVTLQFFYMSIYLFYSKIKWIVVKQQLATVFILSSILLCTYMQENEEDKKFLIGLIASGVTVAFFAAPLTMFMHVIRVKNVDCLPFPMIVGSFLVSAQWLLYGIILNDLFITLPNSIGCLLSGAQLLLFAIFPASGAEDSKHIV